MWDVARTAGVVVGVSTWEGDELIGSGLLASSTRDVDLSALGVELLL